MQHDTYVTAILPICTRYYCDVHVIYISSSNSMLSSLSYDTYKPNATVFFEVFGAIRAAL